MTPKEFLNQVEELLVQQYAIEIGDCTTSEDIEAARVAGETPQGFVDHIGSKYALDSVDTIFGG